MPSYCQHLRTSSLWHNFPQNSLTFRERWSVVFCRRSLVSCRHNYPRKHWPLFTSMPCTVLSMFLFFSVWGNFYSFCHSNKPQCMYIYSYTFAMFEYSLAALAINHSCNCSANMQCMMKVKSKRRASITLFSKWPKACL